MELFAHVELYFSENRQLICIRNINFGQDKKHVLKEPEVKKE